MVAPGVYVVERGQWGTLDEIVPPMSYRTKEDIAEAHRLRQLRDRLAQDKWKAALARARRRQRAWWYRLYRKVVR